MEKTMSSRWFNIVSWGITALIVAAMLGFAFLHIQTSVVTAAATTGLSEDLPVVPTSASVSVLQRPAIERQLTLRTIMPQRPRYAVLVHKVESGDSVFAIAKEYSIKPD